MHVELYEKLALSHNLKLFMCLFGTSDELKMHFRRNSICTMGMNYETNFFTLNLKIKYDLFAAVWSHY